MRSALGWLYIWKNVILVITIILSILIYRPFCKYICPLGAFYSVFNPVSLYKYRVDKDKCIKCGKCAKACQMIVDPVAVSYTHLDVYKRQIFLSACHTGSRCYHLYADFLVLE